MSRRQGFRFNRGRISVGGVAASPSPPPSTPLTILGSLAWWVRADLGITIGTGVAGWADQSGNAVDFTQGVGANQPALIAGAINGQPAVRADAVNDVLSAAWARVAPGTQPVYLWLITKAIAWGANRGLVGDFNAVTGLIIRQNGVTPAVTMFNPTNVNSNTAGTIGSYFRFEAQFGNTVADFLKIGGTEVTGASAGNSAGGGAIQLFGRGDGVSLLNGEIAEAFAFLGTPTGPQRADLDTYATTRYGAGLV